MPGSGATDALVPGSEDRDGAISGLSYMPFVNSGGVVGVMSRAFQYDGLVAWGTVGEVRISALEGMLEFDLSDFNGYPDDLGLFSGLWLRFITGTYAGYRWRIRFMSEDGTKLYVEYALPVSAGVLFPLLADQEFTIGEITANRDFPVYRPKGSGRMRSIQVAHEGASGVDTEDSENSVRAILKAEVFSKGFAQGFDEEEFVSVGETDISESARDGRIEFTFDYDDPPATETRSQRTMVRLKAEVLNQQIEIKRVRLTGWDFPV